MPESSTHGVPGPVTLNLPASKHDLAALRTGDEVRLFGDVYTARDAGHARLLAALSREGELPFGLAGQTLFYAGPTPATDGYPAGSVGPTTAGRMDFAKPELLAAGIVAVIGKGSRSPEARAAFVDNGAVYFAAVGGAAALLGKHVVAAEPIAWPELGTEALVRLTLEDFPVFVALDVLGTDLYEAAPREWRAEKEDAS